MLRVSTREKWSRNSAKSSRPGKGSHRNFRHPVLGVMVTISGRDGDDAKRYLERAVQAAIEEVSQWGKATDT
jgi:hypothetical protein